MQELFESGGYIMYPLVMTCFVIFVLTSYSTVRLFRPSAWADARSKVFVDAILFWGGFASVIGMLGTLIGVMIAAQYIEAAGSVSTAMVWGGIKVALLTSAFGILILAGSSLVWFALQLRWRLLHASASQDELAA